MKVKYLFGLKCYYYNSYKKWYLAIAKTHTHTKKRKYLECQTPGPQHAFGNQQHICVPPTLCHFPLLEKMNY